MSENVVIATLHQLQALKEDDENILVSYSGGKDSLVVLDLVCRVFQKATCFFMYFVPDLKVEEDQVFRSIKNYNAELLLYPHWSYFQIKKDGVYGWNDSDDIPEIKLSDIYAMVRDDTGIKNIVTGAKKSDSLWRRINISQAQQGEYQDTYNPIEDWSLYDVAAYLKYHNIELPEGSGHSNSGIDLSMRSILWLYDNHREDYNTIAEYFPFVGAIVYRREFYGIK